MSSCFHVSIYNWLFHSLSVHPPLRSNCPALNKPTTTVKTQRVKTLDFHRERERVHWNWIDPQNPNRTNKIPDSEIPKTIHFTHSTQKVAQYLLFTVLAQETSFLLLLLFSHFFASQPLRHSESERERLFLSLSFIYYLFSFVGAPYILSFANIHASILHKPFSERNPISLFLSFPLWFLTFLCLPHCSPSLLFVISSPMDSQLSVVKVIPKNKVTQ